MRAMGARIAASDPALKKAAVGWLVFARSPLDSYGPRHEAHLRKERGGHEDVIAGLYYARVSRIDGVIHLTGRENVGRQNTKAKAVWQPQSWLCTVDPADAMPLLNRVRVGGIPGFTPEDDDDTFDPFALLDC